MNYRDAKRSFVLNIEQQITLFSTSHLINETMVEMVVPCSIFYDAIQFDGFRGLNHWWVRHKIVFRDI
jgi:hypothetical protein